MPRRKPKSISIRGRRWFQKSYGNTYFSATIYVNGEKVHHIPFQYGYDEQYLQAATEWLTENGYLPGQKIYESGGYVRGYEPLWQYTRRRNIKFAYHVVDVERKKDL